MSLLSKASLVLTPNAIAEDKLYSIIPSNGDGDMTVTRATTATRVNSEGFIEEVPYNLVKYSEMFTDSSWSKSNTSVTPNVITAPNETLTADLISRSSITLNCQVAQSYSSTKVNTYTGVIYAKLGTISTNFGFRILGNYPNRGDALFNLSTGVLIGTTNGGTNTNTSATITNVGNGWFKLTLTTTFSTIPTALQIQFGATSLTSINAWEAADGALSDAYVWGAQLVQGSVQKDYFPTTDRLNVPRLNYDIAGGCPSILLEPQRTNLTLRSEDFSNTSWYKSNVSVTANTVTSPNGIINVDTIISDGSLINHRIEQSVSVISGSKYTLSVYAKKNTNNFLQLFGSSVIWGINSFANFNIETGVLGTVGSASTAKIEDLGNGWYRCSATFEAISSAVSSVAFSIISSNSSPRGESNSLSTSLYLWGAQFEQGAYPTSYIPTLSSTVTRNADLISRNNIYTNGIITSAGGTWYVELNNNIQAVGDTATDFLVLNVSGTAFGNGFRLYSPSSLSRVQIFKNTNQFLLTTTSNVSKIAIKWNGVTADVFENGIKVVNATAFTTTNMEFLSNGINANAKYIKSTLLFPTPLSDAECISMTT